MCINWKNPRLLYVLRSNKILKQINPNRDFCGWSNKHKEVFLWQTKREEYGSSQQCLSSTPETQFHQLVEKMEVQPIYSLITTCNPFTLFKQVLTSSSLPLYFLSTSVSFSKNGILQVLPKVLLSRKKRICVITG